MAKPSRSRYRTSWDVAIIGGGAAGLSAARALSGAGKSVCLLEARPRLGGRIFSLDLSSLPLPVELGAEFIHGQPESTFGIVDAAALIAAELPDDHWWSQNGTRERIDDFWGQIARVRARIGSQKRDVSFAEFIRRRRDLTPRLRKLACNFVESYHAAHADRISARVLRSADEEQEGENRQFRLAGGQSMIIDWLRAGLDPQSAEVLLGTAATRVEWTEGAVTVHAGDHRIRARSLVLSVPIGVWKAGAIEFDPALDEKERTLKKLEAGHVVKIAFHFREPFWDGINFLHTSDRFMPTWWSSVPLRSNVLTGWAGGHAADALLAEGAEAMTDRALDSLSAAFGIPRKRVDALLVGTFHHDWQADPWSRCAYSYAAVGGAAAHHALGRSIGGTLFFAGEATSPDQTGTVAGAIESGRRAAREILRATRA